MYQYDPQLVADLMAIEREFPATVGSRLSWPKPLPKKSRTKKPAGKSTARQVAR